MPKPLPLAAIRVDPQTQSREKINLDTVLEYAEAMRTAGANARLGQAGHFPPLTVYFDGKLYGLADGTHRLLAARRNGLKHLLADIRLRLHPDNERPGHRPSLRRAPQHDVRGAASGCNRITT